MNTSIMTKHEIIEEIREELLQLAACAEMYPDLKVKILHIRSGYSPDTLRCPTCGGTVEVNEENTKTSTKILN